MLESDGVLVAGANKLVVKHPAFQVWRDSVSAQRQFGEQLGCSPVARERVHARAPAKNLTKMQELLEAGTAEAKGHKATGPAPGPYGPG